MWLADIGLLFRRVRTRVLLLVLAAVPIAVAVAVRLSGEGPSPGSGPRFFDQITNNGVNNATGTIWLFIEEMRWKK